MTRQINAVPNPRPLMSAIAIVLFGAFAISAARDWVPGLDEVKEAAPALVSAELEGGSELNSPRARCMECGIIESRREVWTGGDGIIVTDAAEFARVARGKVREPLNRAYLVTVRMKDGARQEFVDTALVDWRPGERVILIRGRADD